MKRIIITEKQRDMLRSFELNESTDHEIMVKKVVDDLNLNYEPVVGTYRVGGEYFEKPIIKIKADGEKITPQRLLDYLKYKNSSLGDEFLKRVILDWINGDIDNYSLSKNVAMS